MKGLSRLLVALSLTSFLAAPVWAAPITIVGGTPGTIPVGGTNQYIGPLFAGPLVGGYFGGDISVNVPLLSTLTVEFFGAEAGFHNEFNLFATELFDHAGGLTISASLAAPLGSFVTNLVGAGLLPFDFDVNNDAGGVANGSNPNGPGAPNFFASCNPFGGAPGSGGTDCSSVYLFLDDGGAGPDADYDDFLVRLTIQEPSVVPEPATLGLVGLGLLGAARARRRLSRS
jgi:hypothetical protein